MTPRMASIVRTTVSAVFCGAVVAMGLGVMLSGVKSAADLQQAVPLRKPLVDLNGFCQRALGQRASNGVVLYNGGMLEDPRHIAVDISWQAGELRKWDEFARSLGSGYLYVLAPMKLDRKLEMLPVGLDPREHSKHETADDMLGRLGESGIETLDLRPGFCDDLSTIRRYFFRTDHHWRYEAVMKAMPRVARRIAKVAGKKLPADAVPLDRRNWKKHSLSGCFLGSAGRRTGSGFAGYDDFSWYTPKFKTSIELTVPSRKIKRRGGFEKSIIQPSMLANRATFYSAYIGGLFDRVDIVNRSAPCPASVVFVADSYVRPMAGLLSTVFRKIVVLDPRRYKGGCVEFIRSARPDAVVTFVNMKFYEEEFYRFL